MLWLLCEKQAAARGVSEEDFAAGFDGGAIEDAFTALLGAVSDFTQPRKVAAKVRQMLPGELEKAADRMVASLEGRSDPTFSPSPGNSPGSPESTPDR